MKNKRCNAPPIPTVRIAFCMAPHYNKRENNEGRAKQISPDPERPSGFFGVVNRASENHGGWLSEAEE